MDFQTQGYSLQEGEGRLLVSGLAENLLQNSHAQIIERELLDKLLEELKLGTSQLVNQNTALSLGRILAAKVMVTGQLIYSDQMTQVSLKMIETETSRIVAVINEPFGGSPPTSVMTEKTAGKLIGEVKKHYTLRGKILEVKGVEVQLNIGQKVGVRPGDLFNVAGAKDNLILEVVSVQQNTSLARIKKGEGLLQESMQIEAIQSRNN